MYTIVSRLDITQIFCDVDDFCQQWENLWQQVPQLPSTTGERRSTSRMHLSEVMTIVIAFHDRGYISQKLFEELYPRFRRCDCKCCIFENDLNGAF